MRHSLIACALASLLVASIASAHDHAAKPATAVATVGIEEALAPVLAGDWRAPVNVARDRFRNPGPTLAFFGVRPGMAVLEITPGGGWYAEILAPYLRESGRYVGALNDPAKAANERASAYFARQNAALRERFAAAPPLFDRARLVEFDPQAPVFGEPGSMDAVLTFRNVHNWRMNGQEAGMFKGFFEVLKPGGVLGVVEHRAAADVPSDDRSGYVGEAQVIALAEAAGFVLEAKSEINANPKDTKDHPNGVWTLPPTLNVPEGEDRAKYEAIGESDRMTLRFRKPAG